MTDQCNIYICALSLAGTLGRNSQDTPQHNPLSADEPKRADNTKDNWVSNTHRHFGKHMKSPLQTKQTPLLQGHADRSRRHSSNKQETKQKQRAD
jgi:hypothetical protein